MRHGRASIAFVLCGTVVTVLCLFAVWPASAAVAGRTYTVIMKGMKFSPSTLRVQKGDTIVFKNSDLVPHTATAKQGRVFDSGMIKPGESWTFVPTSRASVPYSCTFHPMMEGRIEIEEP